MEDYNKINAKIKSLAKFQQTLEHLIARGDNQQLPLGAMTRNNFIISLKFSFKKITISTSPCFGEDMINDITEQKFEELKKILHNDVLNIETLRLRDLKLLEDCVDEIDLDNIGAEKIHFEVPFIDNRALEGDAVFENLIIFEENGDVENIGEDESYSQLNLDINIDEFSSSELFTEVELNSFNEAFLNPELDTYYGVFENGVLVPNLDPCFFQNNISFDFGNIEEIDQILIILNKTVNIYNTNKILIQKTYDTMYNKLSVLNQGNQIAPQFNAITNKIQYCKELHYNGNLTIYDLSTCISDFINYNVNNYHSYYLNNFINNTGLNFDFTRNILSFSTECPYIIINKLIELGLWIW